MPNSAQHEKIKCALESIEGYQYIHSHEIDERHLIHFRADEAGLKEICRLASRTNGLVTVYLDGDNGSLTGYGEESNIQYCILVQNESVERLLLARRLTVFLTPPKNNE